MSVGASSFSELIGRYVGIDTGVVEADGVVFHELELGGGRVFLHEQHFESGVLVAWQATDEPGSWAVVDAGLGNRQPTSETLSGLLTPRSPELMLTMQRLGQLSVRIGEQAVAFPPLDEWMLADFDGLERIEGADVTICFETADHPFGTMRALVRFGDGRRLPNDLVDTWPELEGSLARIDMPFRSYLRWRAGDVNVLEAVEEGGGLVDARWTVLLLIHGLVQSPGWTDAYSRLPVLPKPLQWWGAAQTALGRLAG